MFRKLSYIVFICLVVLGLNKVDGEDYVAVLENIEAESLVVSGYKLSWYKYLVIPLSSIVNEPSLTMLLLKMSVVIIFCILAIARGMSVILLTLFGSVFCLSLFAENYNEFIRQSHSLLLFLLGLKFDDWRQYMFWFIASLIHLVSIPIIIVTIIIQLIVISNFKVDNIFLLIVLLTAPVMSAILMNLDVNIPGLNGRRTNIFAILMLFGYACLHFWTLIQERSVPNLLIFLSTIIVLVGYGVLLDFGRLVSLLLFLHMGVVMKSGSNRVKTINIFACLMISLAFFLV